MMSDPVYEVISEDELDAFVSALRPLDAQALAKQYQVEGIDLFQSENDEIWIKLHNSRKELTGVTTLIGEKSGLTLTTNNELKGYLLFEGDEPQVTLLTGDYLTAVKVRSETGYKTAFIAHLNDLTDTVDQLAPQNSDEVALFCYEQSSPYIYDLFHEGIEYVDLHGISNVKRHVDKGLEKAKLGVPQGFISNHKGVYVANMKKSLEINIEWLCSPLKVSALTRDIQSKSWGRYVEMVDRDGVVHNVALPMESLTSSSFMQTLVNHGLTFLHGGKSVVNAYLTKANPVYRARSVSKTGWYNGVFVFPEKVIGDTDEKIVYQNANAGSGGSYGSSGTLEQWKNHVSSLCQSNSRLTFGVSVAFASMLLRLVDGESGGFHFRSGSSRGKTTILTLAQSVFGNPESLPRWRTTVNGLEGLATNHNHTLLCLDEFSQLAESSPKQAGEAVYMLGNGEGKQRSRSNGSMSERSSWQLLYLSAGEVSLESVLTRAGLQVRAGQEVRFIDLPADAGANLGVFDTVQEYQDGNQFALNIKEKSLRYYGSASEAFLEKVTVDYLSVQQQLIVEIKAFLETLELTHSDPQVHRVALRFAQVAASGEMASSLGITGWSKGEASRSARSCFDSWIESRGGHGSQESTASLTQARRQLVNNSTFFVSTSESSASLTLQSWGLQDNDYFYVQPSRFKDNLCEGRDVKSVEGALIEAEYLSTSAERPTSQKRFQGEVKRYYKISKGILSFGEEEERDYLSVDEILES